LSHWPKIPAAQQAEGEGRYYCIGYELLARLLETRGAVDAEAVYRLVAATLGEPPPRGKL
jgi:hypothetical protein